MASRIQHIEQAFHALQFNLNSGVGSLTRLSLYAQFLRKLSDRDLVTSNLSYYQEIFEDFANLLTTENLSYRSPEFLHELATDWDVMRKSGLAELDSGEFREKYQILQYRELAARFYLGDIQTAAGLLNLEISEFQSDSGMTRHETFLALYKFLGRSGRKIPEQLELVRSEWQELACGDSNNTIYIPVVEISGGSKNQEIITATIQPLTVEVELRRREADTDLIFFNNHPLGPNDLIYFQALDAIEAAKRQLQRRVNGNHSHFRVMFGFPDSQYLYTGESFGLGLSLATLCQLETVTIQRVQHRLRKDVVITGAVDVNGGIRAVSEQSLAAKVEAFSNSPFQKFVHPDSNQRGVENTVQALEQRPGVGNFDQADSRSDDEDRRKQILVSAHTNAQVIQDKRIGVKHRLSYQQWAKTGLKKNRLLRYSAIAFIILFIGYFGWYIGRDVNPVGVRIEGEYLYALNRSGEVLWSYAFPFRFDPKIYTPQTISNCIQVVDLQGDGRNEILLGTRVSDSAWAGRIYCFTSGGELLWIYGDHLELDCTRGSYDAFYYVKQVLTYQEEPNVPPTLLVCFGHRLFYPNRIVQLDMTGRVLQEFWHSGQILGMRVIRNTGDESDQLVFWGTNNLFNQGILASLDLDQMAGCSPEFEDNCRGLTAAQPNTMRYLRFPVPGKYRINDKHNRPDIGFGGVSENGQLMFYLRASGTAMAIYDMTRDLELQNIVLSDSYLGEFRNFRGVPLFEYDEPARIYEHFSEIEYWNGQGWDTR